MKAVIATLALGLAFAAGTAVAGPKAGHPNLEEASKNLKLASERISAAQVANEFDMDGHAAKAKDLIAQAQVEIDRAAVAANENHR